MSNAVTVPADKLAQLQRDAARLDWIERQDLSNLLFDRSGGRVAVILGGAVHGKTLRDAIDAAMRDTP
jgi:hypothetical protein